MKNSLLKSNQRIQDSNEISDTKLVDNFPLVSVLIPLYNHEEYILDTLESIITQDYPNLEIVLIDDASIDKGLQLAKNKLSSIRFNCIILKNEVNKGICVTVNRAISNAKGKYTCLIASDDLLAKGRIRQHIQILEKSIDTSVICCHGPIQVFDKDNSQLTTKGNLNGSSDYTLASTLTKKTRLNLQGCTFVTKKLKKIPFDENLYFEDWDFFIRLFLNNYKIINVKNIAAHYRKHEGGTNLNIVKMVECRNQIRDKYFKIIAAKDKKLANSFNFTIKYWNFIGISYQGNIIHWFFVLIKLFITNPLNMIQKLRDTFWAFRNLFRAK